MRYRLVEENIKKRWQPIAVLYEEGGKVVRYMQARALVLQVDSPNLEKATAGDFLHNTKGLRTTEIREAPEGLGPRELLKPIAGKAVSAKVPQKV